MSSRLAFALLALVGLSCAHLPGGRLSCYKRSGELLVTRYTPESHYLDVYQRQCDQFYTWDVSIRRDDEIPGVGVGNVFSGRTRDAERFRVRAIWVDSGVVIVPDSTLVVLRRDTLVRGIRIFYAPMNWRLRN